MLFTPKTLKKIIKKAIKEELYFGGDPKTNDLEKDENDGSEAVLEDAVSILELISQRIMNFPIHDKKALSILPQVIDTLEKIDGFLSRFARLQENSFWGKAPVVDQIETDTLITDKLNQAKQNMLEVVNEFHKRGGDISSKKALYVIKLINLLVKESDKTVAP